jgi:CheY-like chemotaxis protein
LDPDQQEAVGIIQNSSEILITLVNDILDFSKINSEKLALEKIPFSLEKTVKLIYDLLLKKAEQKNIHLEKIFDDNIPKKIMGDKIRINQIIMNLAGNAIKFTQKGSVTIEVKLLEESEKDLTIHFSVRDTGIGIPEDKIDKIFERFEQAGTEVTRKFGGTGLGLNISKNLVDLHGGKLEVKSIFGQGSEFYFVINFDKVTINNEVQEELKIVKLKSDLIKSNLEKLRVLICEDNSVNIKLINHMFKGKVTHLEIAENGKVAIEILKRKMFDVILMDVHMPEMDGLETTKYIRNNLKLNLPIIGFTATSSQAERELCLEVGMNDCITKSFISDELFQNMCKVVSVNKVYKEDLLTEENNFYFKRNNNKLLTKSQKHQSKLNLNKIYSEHNINRQTLEKKSSHSSKKLIFVSTNENNNSLFECRKNSSNSSHSLNQRVNRKNSIKLSGKSQYVNSSKKVNFKVSRIFSFKNYEYGEDSKINKEDQKDFHNPTKFQILKNNPSSSDDESSKEFISDREKNIMIINSEDDEEQHQDYIHFNLLKEFSGDDMNLEKEIIELFLNNIPLEVETLLNEILFQNLKEIKFKIHKMKNSLEIFGLRIIIQKMEKIVNLCEMNNYNLALENFHGLKNDMQNIYNEMNKKLEHLE